MRPMILAGVHQHGERVGQRPAYPRSSSSASIWPCAKRFIFRALSRLVAPEVEQVADPATEKLEVKGAADEAQHVDIGSRIIAVAGVLPISSRMRPVCS